MNPDWTPHRRDDGEVLGWIRPEGSGWVAVDILGRDVTGAVEWLDAEEALDARGLGWLAEKWMLERDGAAPLAVRLVEVTPERVVVKSEDFGAIDAPLRTYVLAWPAPAALRLREPEDTPLAF